MLFKEYLKEPEKTQEAFDNGWSSAGDMVRRDEDGYYTLVDRKANMIITGGENVYPSEVESVRGGPRGRQGHRRDRHSGREMGRVHQGGGRCCTMGMSRTRHSPRRSWISAGGNWPASSAPRPSISSATRTCPEPPRGRFCTASSGKNTENGATPDRRTRIKARRMPMLTKAYIPYKGYYSTPFCRWQGSLANEHAWCWRPRPPSAGWPTRTGTPRCSTT